MSHMRRGKPNSAHSLTALANTYATPLESSMLEIEARPYIDGPGLELDVLGVVEIYDRYLLGTNIVDVPGVKRRDQLRKGMEADAIVLFAAAAAEAPYNGMSRRAFLFGVERGTIFSPE